MSQVLPSGSATVLAGNTSVTVTHTLGYAPDVTKIFLQAGDDLGAKHFLPCTNPTSTTFNINIDSADSIDHLVNWFINQFPNPTPAATAYCSPADVEALAQIKYDQFEYADLAAYENALTSLFIPMAQKIIDSYVDHNFLNNTGTVLLDGNGHEVLMVHPPYVPILTAGTVLINSVNVTANIKAYDSYLAYQGGVFTQDSSSRKNVSVTLNYGYTSVPSDVRFVCAQIVANILSDMLRRKLMPDTVSRAMQSNSDTVIISGMTKNTQILTSELMAILDQYRFSRLDVT